MKRIAFVLILGLFAFVSDQKQVLTTEEYNALSESEKRNINHAIDGLDLLDPELEISLFASEPMMTNPTNMDIDDKGRVWICEAYNYRNALNPRNPYNKKGDRILILEDTNNDGKADKSKVFYQGEDINAALGIAILGNKTYVSCSPNVFVFTDLDGDDVPDKKEILYTGIGGTQHDHGMHAFIFGPDGKLYFNYGNAGEGLLTKDKKPIIDEFGNEIKANGKPYREGMVYRSDLDGSNVEILAWNFRNNYELTIDSYGRMWQSDNDDDGNRSTRINYVMDYGNYGYKDEMTGADWRVRRTNLEDSVFHKHWHLNDPGVIPNLLQTFAGSPTGIVMYEGNLLPKKFQNQLIHCDAGPNIVRAYPTSKSGAGFKGSIIPIIDGSKKDKWFRPSDVTVAPDGAIFISDWYDPGVGGHAMGDSTRGRVYRIAPKNNKPTLPKYDYSNPSDAVNALKSPNQSIRFMAYQAIQKMGLSAENELKKLIQGNNPIFAARAYWLLSEINNYYIEHASKSENEDLRVLSIRMARKHYKNPSEFLLEMAADPSIQVKREVALAIRHKKHSNVWLKLVESFDGSDRWFLEALGIAANNNWDEYLEQLKNKVGEGWLQNNIVKEVIWRSRSKKTTAYLEQIIKNTPLNQRDRFYRAFDFQQSTDKNEVLLRLIKSSTSSNEKVTIFKLLEEKSLMNNPILKREIPILLTGIKNNLDFITIINKYSIKTQFERLHNIVINSAVRTEYEDAAKTCVKLHGNAGLIKGMANKSTAFKAIDRYGEIDEDLITAILTKTIKNKNLGFDLRLQAMKEMRGRESEAKLWQMYKSNQIPSDLINEAKIILKRTYNSDIRSEANKIFASEDNKKAVDMERIFNLKPNTLAGKEVYESYCSTCHLAQNSGIDFGPNLGQIGNKLTKQSLLNAILHPSEGISFGYEGSLITLNNGSTLQAIITSKTENNYMIKYPGQSQMSVLKIKNTKSVLPIGESLMPKFPLSENELANLVGYLETLK